MSDEVSRWRLIDRRVDLTPSELSIDDQWCYYYRDKIDGGYSASESNQLIFNLKAPKNCEKDNPPRWSYKLSALERFVSDCRLFFDDFIKWNPNALIGIVPVFSSKPKSHIEYDSRIESVARALEASYPQIEALDVFDINEEFQPSHLGGTREISALVENVIVSNLSLEKYDVLFLLDDVITSGAHYIACKKLLIELCPEIAIAGLFWAKTEQKDYTYAFIGGCNNS